MLTIEIVDIHSLKLEHEGHQEEILLLVVTLDLFPSVFNVLSQCPKKCCNKETLRHMSDLLQSPSIHRSA